MDYPQVRSGSRNLGFANYAANGVYPAQVWLANNVQVLRDVTSSSTACFASASAFSWASFNLGFSSHFSAFTFTAPFLSWASWSAFSFTASASCSICLSSSTFDSNDGSNNLGMGVSLRPCSTLLGMTLWFRKKRKLAYPQTPYTLYPQHSKFNPRLQPSTKLPMTSYWLTMLP